MSDGAYCETCQLESALCYKCSHCGKPFDGDETGGNGRAPYGGGR